MSEPRPPLSAADEERLARYRAGALAPAEREAFEREVLASDALAEALYSEQSLDAVRIERRRPGARHLLALAAAVLAVTMVALLWPRPLRDPRAPDPETLRGAQAGLRLLAPVGGVDSLPQFRWSRDPGAVQYRIEVFDAGGRTVAVTVVADTMVAAAAIGADTLRAGTWRVVPIGGDGGERPAPPAAEFRYIASVPVRSR